MNLLPILENGLFALGQVLRFPVFVLLWVCVASAVFMAASCVVDFVARRRERRSFDITGWLKSGPAIAGLGGSVATASSEPAPDAPRRRERTRAGRAG